MGATAPFCQPGGTGGRPVQAGNGGTLQFGPCVNRFEPAVTGPARGLQKPTSNRFEQASGEGVPVGPGCRRRSARGIGFFGSVVRIEVTDLQMTMYTTCLFCHGDLGSNEVLEDFPVGRRVAFDPEKGRLWAVCGRCGRWNLSPLLERWEATEACERRFRETRTRVSTEQIGLARLDEGLELVRIGRPLRPEYAAWRYGDELGRRRRRAWLVGSGLTAAGASLALGGWAAGLLAAGVAPHLLNLVTNGFSLYRTQRTVARIPRPDGSRLTVRGRHLRDVRLRSDDDSEAGWSLQVRDVSLEGSAAVRAAGTLLANINHAGASSRRVREAVRQLEDVPDPLRYFPLALDRAGEKGYRYSPVSAFPKEIRLALEMAAHEEAERRALQGELAELETAWREAEEIAAIADDLLLPEAVRERIRFFKG